MDDHELSKRLREGDTQALDIIMRQYTKLLWSVAGAILKNAGSREDIEECVSDAFIEIWNRPQKYNPDRGSLQTYLALAAKSKALNRAKKLRREYALPIPEDLSADRDDIERAIIAQETEKAALAAVDTLPEPDREVFIRRHILGQKPDEIRRAMGIPARKVTNILYNSRVKLKNMLRNWREPDTTAVY